MFPDQPSSSPRNLRIEYRGFRNVAEAREFDFVATGPAGVSRFRFVVPLELFDGRAVRLQDGPDLCYQVVLHVYESGTAQEEQTVHIGADEVEAWRVVHSPRTRAASPRKPPVDKPLPPRMRRPVPTPSLLPSAPAPSLPFGVGQRVHHEVYGDGVTRSCTREHTVVCFDAHGPKTFLTSVLQLEILSAPNTWEVGPRGKVRPRATPAS